MPSETSLIFGNYSCLVAIIALFICQCHSISHYFRHKSDMDKIQMKIMLMELIMNICFLFPIVCNAFIRSNYFTPYRSEDDFTSIQCKIAMVTVVPFYSVGKAVLYTILTYRIYVCFKGSLFRINKKIPFTLIIVQSVIIIPFFIFNVINVFHKDNKAIVEHIDGDHDILYCNLEYDPNAATIALIFLFLPIIQMLIDTVVCVYLMALFVIKLRKLTAELILIEEIKAANVEKASASSIEVGSDAATTDVSPSQSVPKKVQRRSVPKVDESQKYVTLRSIAVKQTILATSALLATLLFYVYGIATKSSDFMGFAIVVNTFSIHLMFNYSDVIWNALLCKLRTR